MVLIKSRTSVFYIIVINVFIKTYINDIINKLGSVIWCSCFIFDSSNILIHLIRLCVLFYLYKTFLLYLIIHCKSVSSFVIEFTKSFTFLYSSSFKSFLLLSSIKIVSFVGKLLYFCTNLSTSINKISRLF